jgi:6-phosphogluconolactonase
MAVLTVLADPEALAEAAAERVTARAESVVRAEGSLFLALAGGHTPRRLYELLADPARPWRARVPWPNVHVLWGDERHVPPDDPESNFGMADRALLKHVPVPASQIHRVRAEMPDAPAAARAYEATLRAAFAAAGRRNPYCDLLLLGIGADAHVASIFPGSPLLDDLESAALVAAVPAPQPGTWRITLTPSALLHAASMLVLAEGDAKAEEFVCALCRDIV